MGSVYNEEKLNAHLILVNMSVNALIVFAVEFTALLIAYRIIRCRARGKCHCHNKKK